MFDTEWYSYSKTVMYQYGEIIKKVITHKIGVLMYVIYARKRSTLALILMMYKVKNYFNVL